MERLTRIAEMMVIAGKNTIRNRHFDADRYATALENGRTPENDPALREEIGMAGRGETTQVIDFPCIITDNNDRIICWYLPEVLGVDVQDYVLSAVQSLSPELKKSTAKPLNPTAKGPIPWRRDAQYFRPADETIIPPGTITFAPVWHQPGHPHPKYLPTEGASWRSFRHTDRFQQWIDNMDPLMWAMFAMASLCHGGQLGAFYKSYMILREQDQKFEDAFQNWEWPGHGLALIANRQTPFHRDRKTSVGMYDMIATCGQYADGDFAIDELGIRLRYKPGTLINIAGGMLRHAAETGEGERVAAVCFMREELMLATGIEIPFLTSMQLHQQDLERWVASASQPLPDDDDSVEEFE
ncbi:hypothetical protein BDW22DRAFT_1430694 [Trametopsis cervina]|nr:hypothetical protein BDW22DRAFT_1430694 [Trametopsis cervina]